MSKNSTTAFSVAFLLMVATCALISAANVPNEKTPYDSYDLDGSDAEFYEKLRHYRQLAALNAMSMAAALNSAAPMASSSEIVELTDSAANMRGKRGRQCLWKICSWPLEKQKKKSQTAFVEPSI